MLKNLKTSDIKKDVKIKESFINADFKDLKINCNIYKGNFYLDSFNYFTIDENYNTFDNLFKRDFYQNHDHFFTSEFFENFKKNLNSYKKHKNIFVIGSSAANNYYSNLIQFLPRIFFINDKKIKIAIHRNSSTKFREFIKLILNNRQIEFSFIYLDDGFYNFEDSQIPQFFDISKSVKILKNFLSPNPNSKKFDEKKIYVTREDSTYRKIINEADITPILRSKGYKIINPQLYSINEQIELFSQADKILAPYGSNLSNIIFCKPGTEIYEIGPKFENKYEKIFENRYKFLAEINKLNYKRFITDTVPVSDHSELAKKYIDKTILRSSNYYKNLIIQVKDINNIN